MNPSTASHRLKVDILFKFVIEAGNKCFQCNKTLTRQDFSIEHKIPWLDSDDPIKLYFDLDNIAYSHQSCNFSAARKPHKIWNSKKESQDYHNSKRTYSPKKRRKKYLKTGW